jgi:hypothetical protein
VLLVADTSEKFDWASYLLEGEEINVEYYDDSPVSSYAYYFTIS